MHIKAVVFDCDGVLVDAQSSWAIIHSHFGTDSSEMLQRFMRREITDAEFMADDIRQWKNVQPEIHRDDLFRCYSGLQLMRGARELIIALGERNILTTIVSAGVDLFISSVASMLEIDDWAANGFEFDEFGWLQDEGVVRVPAHHKGELVKKLCRIKGLNSDEVVSIGDSRSDLSMRIKGSNFIGFSPNHDACRLAFEEAGVPIVDGKDCRNLWPIIFGGEFFPE